MAARFGWFFGLCFTGCAAGHSPVLSPAPVPPPASSASAQGIASPVSSASAATPAAVVPAPAAAVLELDLTPVLSVPVTAIGIGEGTRVAALADVPYVGDARGVRAVPLPASLRAKPGEVDEANIYFGRDNEPRIMGSRRSGADQRAIYLRHLPNGWRDGREEIGQLGGPAPGGLWGVLGSADPELVCRVNAQCIIKRQSGWTTAPAGTQQRAVTLQGGVLWGLDESGISGIDAHGWALAIPAPAAKSMAKAFFATQGEAWLSAEHTLFHYSAGAWHSEPSPVGNVSGFWGSASHALWVVGSAGAAYFDGVSFRVVRGAPALSVVRGRGSSEVWFGGPTGLFRASLPNGFGARPAP